MANSIVHEFWESEENQATQRPQDLLNLAETESKRTDKMRASKRDWMFRVQVPNLEKNEFVYVVGNLPELGAWNHNQAIQLAQENSKSDSPTIFDSNSSCGDIYSEDGQDGTGDSMFNDSNEEGQTFSQKVALPSDADVQYRYFIAVVFQSNGTKNFAKTLIIRRWETHMTPRVIKRNAPSNVMENFIPNAEKFGCYNGYCKIERGWLTDETSVQFKLFNNPIKLWKNRLQNKQVHIKMTPVNLTRHSSLELQQFGGECVDDSLSMDTQDIIDQPAFNITEIAVMNDEECFFKSQEQFGRAYNEGDVIVFNVAVRYPETVAYLVDYYVYGSRSYPGEPPNHIGFSYILPSTLQSSVGLLTVPITSTKHRPIGQLTVEYVTIKPIPDYPWDMSISYAKHWEQRWSGLDVGHRGLGPSFRVETKHCANVRENTIASLKKASYHGADMVEFDVQLSKDLIPVIYHDFYVSISLKRKKQIEAMDMLEIPVKDLTLEQLHLLKDLNYPKDSLGNVLCFIDREDLTVNESVYHVAEGREKNPRFFDEDLEDHQPFPTLQAVLQELEPHVGCNIEIKWTMQLKDGSFELNHPFDVNMYLDIILKVVLEYGGDRKVVFSTFHPDICYMIRLKQNKYPVMFLTQGLTAKYPTYHDPRCQDVQMAARQALAADILGINVHSEDILRDPSLVKKIRELGLIIFCWGDDNNDKETIKHLKKLGLHAVLYDKIDEYNVKEVKESVFLVDARENQKALIALAHCNQNGQSPVNQPINQPINQNSDSDKEYYKENGHNNDAHSNAPSTTATSLTSTAKNNATDENIYSLPAPEYESLEAQEERAIGDLTKDFSVCAKSFGHPPRPKTISEHVCDKSEKYAEDESAGDCI